MTIPPTMSYTDIYGSNGPGRPRNATLPSDEEKASGPVVGMSSKSPSLFLLVIIGILIGIRFLWEKGG